VGRTLELTELGSPPAGSGESGTAAVADRILEALKSRPEGLRWEEIRGLFDSNHSDEEIRQALRTLMKTPRTRISQQIEKKGEHSSERFLLAAS
jgi:hypothetical protein